MKANCSNTLRKIEEFLAENRKMMIILIGAPGSGKSTFIDLLGQEGHAEKFTVASTDNIIYEEMAKTGKDYNTMHREMNWKWANSKFKLDIRTTLNDGRNLIVDRTNMGKKVRRTYFEGVRNKDYVKIALNFQVSDTELARRLKERGEATGKWIGKKVLEDMFARYEAPSKDEGFNVIIDVLTE